MPSSTLNPDLLALLDYLKRSRGFDFTGYKPNTLTRRITKRMQIVGVNTYGEYMDFLEVQPEEFVQLFNTILINVTDFFRDPPAWEAIAKTILPKIIDAKQPGDPIRVWSTGCASGEEAYTIAILLCEALGEDQFRERVKIYATDVDEEALDKARLAIYTEKDVANIPEHLLQKYFMRSGTNFSFIKELRRNIIFGRNDLVQDAPISRVDLLICRNTLMYFNADAQTRILSRFHFALIETGYLYLGRAEMLLTHTNIFTPLDLKLRIFNKVPKANLRDRLMLATNADNENGVNQLFGLLRLRDEAFETSPMAQVVIDVNNTLLQANSRARELFGLSLKDLGRPFQDLEMSFRPVELRSAIQRAYSQHVPIMLKDIEWFLPSGESCVYDVRVQPLTENGTLILGVSITFNDVTQLRQMHRQLQQSTHELETALEELQSTNEELETTNEELQSTIEELETTNEELQSTNEELETINEEIQSTNEELQTINDELQIRTGELNQANNFLESILTSIHLGVIVVDTGLHIQSWNTRSEELWGLRTNEVYGNNLMALDIGLPVEQLRRALMSVIEGGNGTRDQVVSAHNRTGKEIVCRVNYSPLTAKDKTIEGAIILIEEDGSRAVVER